MKLNELNINPLFEESQKEKRLLFLKSRLSDKWAGVPGYDDLDKFLKAVARIDPTIKGTMMNWIASLAIKNPNLNKTEDFNRLKKDLVNFETFKARLQIRDINQYKSYQDLYTATEQFTKKNRKLTDKEKFEKRVAKYRGEIIDVYRGSEGWIKIPTTRQSACFLGQKTRWCTSARNQNAFDQYNKSDRLFIVYDKNTQSRFQIHLSSGAFADEADKHMDFGTIPKWATPHIANWYKENNPDLSFKQLMNLSKIADVSEFDSDHRDLLQLMKDYA